MIPRPDGGRRDVLSLRASDAVTARSTSSHVAIEVSPGVVMANAPWAMPTSTASEPSRPSISAHTTPETNPSPPPQ